MINAPNVQEWLSAIGLVYWAAALIGAGVAWKLAARRSTKIIGVVVVLGFFLYWPVSEAVRNTMERSAFNKRYEAAAARFAERCKIAGDKIVRTVDDVEGIFVLKIRTQKDIGYGNDQMSPSAAFYHEGREDGYLKSFLWSEERAGAKRGRLYDRRTVPDFPGYAYVDFVDPNDSKRYRYRLVEKPEGNPSNQISRVTERTPATEPAPRFGVTFEDLVDPEDRTHWIAGSIVKIVDLEANDEIARHTRFAFDQGLGGRAGARTPWASPLFCPVIGPSYASMTRHFVDQVLKPKMRN